MGGIRQGERHGLDFNPTFFSHPKMKDGLTLSSPDDEIRNFWIEHGKACIRISQYFADETGVPCVMNIWTGDGTKDVPADRLGPRQRYKDAIEQIIAEPHDPNMVKPCVESKVFGIGVESYTVGSAEFALSFAATHEGCLPLMDNGHYHPTEVVSDKIPALLAFFPEIALHITRPVRWDSDHVVIYDDETREMAKEIVRCDALDRVDMALDYFDASINRNQRLGCRFPQLAEGSAERHVHAPCSVEGGAGSGELDEGHGRSGEDQDDALRRRVGRVLPSVRYR